MKKERSLLAPGFRGIPAHHSGKAWRTAQLLVVAACGRGHSHSESLGSREQSQNRACAVAFKEPFLVNYLCT